MHRPELASDLQSAFDADPDVARVVARAAGDLSDSGAYRDDVGSAIDGTLIVAELQDAPADSDLVERWNWWIGSLELAYGDYEQFLVSR
ncbi:hypothetical protein L593_11435 [Salinarchaeum sp. Harcht-Bsk1]|uniref:hypothetical protein n=1 Tax=Salinarchaeum sp. Harcht-Bsk1 TaxID=1333523 RepID=UPI00034230B3|nr:hypothetical protein [Salinarchaeum sp. Harcht-Bsk1]AGN02232.1 hypothetical protein L593_11435 [Salinarchaeum sp. Harcht-Bsk1]